MTKEQKLKDLLDYIYEIDYSLTPSETMIIQKQRNELKYNLLEAIVEVLVEAGVPEGLINRTADGYIFELQNKEHGMIPIEIDVKVKNMNYDVYGAIEEWESKVEQKKYKEEKALKEATEKERRKKEQDRLKKQRMEKVMAEYEEYKRKNR